MSEPCSWNLKGSFVLSCCQVLVVLKEKGVKYEETLVDILNGEQDEPWYIRKNPSALVPALEDGENLVKESQDIMDYVDREFPSGRCRKCHRQGLILF